MSRRAVSPRTLAARRAMQADHGYDVPPDVDETAKARALAVLTAFAAGPKADDAAHEAHRRELVERAVDAGATYAEASQALREGREMRRAG